MATTCQPLPINVPDEKTPLIDYGRRPSPTFNLHGTCLICNTRSVGVQQDEELGASRQKNSGYQEIGDSCECEEKLLENKTDEKQSDFVIIFAYWNAMMGSSLLAMPWAFQQAGFVQGLAVIIFISLICSYTCYIIYVICRSQSSNGIIPEFAEVVDRLFGYFGRILCAATSFVLLGGCLMVYWILMVQLLYNSVNSIHYFTSEKIFKDENLSSHVNDSLSVCDQKHESEGVVSPLPGWTENRTVPLFLVVVFFPIMQLKSMAFFNRLAAAGCFVVIFLVGYTFYKVDEWGLNVEFNDVTSPQFVPLSSKNFPVLSGIMGMAFFSHNSVITVFRRSKNPEKSVRNMTIAYFLVLTTYIVIGMGLYLSYPNLKSCIQQNFFENIYAGDMLSLILQVLYFFRMATLFPIVSFVLRVQVFTGIYNSEYPGYNLTKVVMQIKSNKNYFRKFQVATLNAIIITLSVLCSMFYPQIGDIIRYVGSLCGMIYMYLLPCIVYLYLDITKRARTNRDQNPVIIIIHCAIMLIGILNFFAQFLVA